MDSPARVIPARQTSAMAAMEDGRFMTKPGYQTAGGGHWLATCQITLTR
jgi:hypothetical protein